MELRKEQSPASRTASRASSELHAGPPALMGLVLCAQPCAGHHKAGERGALCLPHQEPDILGGGAGVRLLPRPGTISVPVRIRVLARGFEEF